MHRNSVARLSKIEWFSFHPISFWRFIVIIKHLVIVTNKCWDYRRILFHYRRFTIRGDNQGRSFISLIFLSKYLCRVKEWRFRDCERVLNYYAKIFLLFSFPFKWGCHRWRAWKVELPSFWRHLLSSTLTSWLRLSWLCGILAKI